MKRILLCALVSVVLLTVLAGCGKPADKYHGLEYTINEDRVLFTYEGLTVSVVAGTYLDEDPDFRIKNESDVEYWVSVEDRIVDGECQLKSLIPLSMVDRTGIPAFRVKGGEDGLLSECEKNRYESSYKSRYVSGGAYGIFGESPIYCGTLEYRFEIYAVTEEEITEESTAVNGLASDSEKNGDDLLIAPGVKEDRLSSAPRKEDLLYRTNFICIKTTDYDKVNLDRLPKEEPFWEKDGIRLWYDSWTYDISSVEYIARSVYVKNDSDRDIFLTFAFVAETETDFGNIDLDYVEVYAQQKSGTLSRGGETVDSAPSERRVKLVLRIYDLDTDELMIEETGLILPIN